MTERQLKRIIKKEINNVLKEGIGDIKRAQRAGNKNFVDPLIAKKNAREEQVAQSKINKLWASIDNSVYEYVRKYRYKEIASELNKIAEPINKSIKKYGLTLDITKELEASLNLGEPNDKSHRTLDLYTLVRYDGQSDVLDYIINGDGIIDNGGTSLVSIGSSFGLYFFEHPFNETYGDSIGDLVKLQITDEELDQYVDGDIGDITYESLSPEDKVEMIAIVVADLSEEIGEFIKEAANTLKDMKPDLIHLAKMYK